MGEHPATCNLTHSCGDTGQATWVDRMRNYYQTHCKFQSRAPKTKANLQRQGERCEKPYRAHFKPSRPSAQDTPEHALSRKFWRFLPKQHPGAPKCMPKRAPPCTENPAENHPAAKSSPTPPRKLLDAHAGKRKGTRLLQATPGQQCSSDAAAPNSPRASAGR